MKNLFIILAFLSVSITSYSQKVKTRNNIAYIDGKPYIRWVNSTLGNETSVYALNSDNEDIFITSQTYTDPHHSGSSNTNGTVSWIEFNFLDLNLKFEISPRFPRNLILLLYQNKVYVNGDLNVKNAKRLASKYGTRFSDNRQNGVKVIINN